jgi:hypothetical protein
LLLSSFNFSSSLPLFFLLTFYIYLLLLFLIFSSIFLSSAFSFCPRLFLFILLLPFLHIPHLLVLVFLPLTLLLWPDPYNCTSRVWDTYIKPPRHVHVTPSVLIPWKHFYASTPCRGWPASTE